MGQPETRSGAQITTQHVFLPARTRSCSAVKRLARATMSLTIGSGPSSVVRSAGLPNIMLVSWSSATRFMRFDNCLPPHVATFLFCRRTLLMPIDWQIVNALLISYCFLSIQQNIAWKKWLSGRKCDSESQNATDSRDCRCRLRVKNRYPVRALRTSAWHRKMDSV